MANLFKPYVRFIVFGVIWCLIIIGNVSACSPSSGDPWFKISLDFDQDTLPGGILIVETDPYYEPYAIKNLNDEPFYLITPYRSSKDFYDEDYPNSELPSDYAPKFKLISEKVYFYGQTSSSDFLGWKENSGGLDNAAASQVRLTTSYSVSEIMIIEDGFENLYADERPYDVEIPTQQSFKIQGYYKDELIEITGIISYLLNEDYYPNRRAEGIEACNEWVSFPLITFGVIVLILIVIISILLYFKKKK